MKSKVNPRLLIALGVVLVLVVAFGAVKLLGGSDDAASEQTEPALVSGEGGAGTEGDQSAIDGAPIVDTPGDGSSDWGDRANVICGNAIADLAAQPAATTPEDAADALTRAGAVVDQLAALPAPSGAEADTTEFVGLLRGTLEAAETLIGSGDEPDFEQVAAFLQEQAVTQSRLEQLAADLGAQGCLGASVDTADPATSEPDAGGLGLVDLQAALEENETVVLVVYSPSAELDTRVVREARAGASGGGAGFLAVNGLRESHVKALAETFDVRETPSTIVVNRGLIVSSQFSGFADRETVAQAVRNSLGTS